MASLPDTFEEFLRILHIKVTPEQLQEIMSFFAQADCQGPPDLEGVTITDLEAFQMPTSLRLKGVVRTLVTKANALADIAFTTVPAILYLGVLNICQ